jgi:hypothetical protein
MAAGTGYAQLVSLYRDAERRLEGIVRQAAMRGHAYTERFASMQLQHIRQITDRLAENTPAMAYNAVATAYGTAVQAVHAATPGLSTESLLQGGFTGVHEEAVSQLAQALAAPLVEAANFVGREARDAFQQAGVHEVALGIATGEKREQIAAHMVDRLTRQGITGFQDAAGRNWKLGNYADMVTRTTTREAVTAGTRNRLTDLGLDLVTISDHGDTDELCAEFAGNTYSLSGETPGYEQLTDEPPFHPNLLPFTGDVRVEAIGEVLAGSQATWTGELIDVTTACGIRLSVGPHHPVLTTRGWVPAYLLREGDQVVRDLRVPGDDAPRVVEDLYDPPPLAEEVFDSLAALGHHAWVAASSTDLHGDGEGVEGQIDVVWADGLLPGEIHPSLIEKLDQSSLVTAGLGRSSLPRFRSPGEDIGSIPLPAPRRARLLADIAGCDAALAESLQDRARGTLVATAKLVGRSASEIALAEVASVDKREVCGIQVGDLQTSSAWYWANGILTHNCIHVMTPAEANQEQFLQQLTEEGEGDEATSKVLPGEPSEKLEPLGVNPEEVARDIVEAAKGLDGNTASGLLETGSIRSTLAQHTLEGGSLTPEREALHRRIIEQFTAGHASQEEPRALFTAGGSASGKTALYERIPGAPKDAVIVDPDKVRVLLPEYDLLQAAGRGDIAAGATHAEASGLAKDITNVALAGRQNVIVDGVGGGEPGKFADKIAKVRDQGYATEVRYAHTPLSEAERRNQVRYEKTGRFVAPDILRAKHAEVAARYQEVRKLPGVKIKVYNTGVPKETKRIPLVSSQSEKGTLTVRDLASQRDFEAKAVVPVHGDQVPGLLDRAAVRITETQKAALDDYRVRTYYAMNSLMRGTGRPPSGAVTKALADQAQHISEAIQAQKPLDAPIEVWRGVVGNKSEEEVLGRLQKARIKGEDWTEPAFASTSHREQFARDWAGPNGVAMRIILPKGSRVYQMHGSNEGEVLLDRGTRFRVIEVRPREGTRQAEVVLEAQLPGHVHPGTI